MLPFSYYAEAAEEMGLERNHDRFAVDHGGAGLDCSAAAGEGNRPAGSTRSEREARAKAPGREGSRREGSRALHPSSPQRQTTRSAQQPA